MTLKEFENKKVLILGFGREGIETFLFLKKRFPKQTFGIADKKTLREFSQESRRILEVSGKNAARHFGPTYLEAIGEYDVIVRSPGIPPRVLKPLLLPRQRVTTQTEIFFANCKGVVIGITGTKGKSTTSSLMYRMLKAAGKPAHLIGNIGTPGIQLLDTTGAKDLFVYELSSFQLMGLPYSPHIAVLLNVYPEHFDLHKDFAEYRNAKAAICSHQTTQDILIYNKADPVASRIAAKSKAKKIPFAPGSSSFGKSIEKKWVAPIEPAILAASLCGVKDAVIEKVLREFRPLPHRLERVGEWRGVTFYNDSAATNPGATIAAMNLIGKNLHTIILGGSDKKISYRELAKEIIKQKIPFLVLLPETGAAIWKEIESAARKARVKALPERAYVSAMKEAVRACYARTPAGRVCLLSPASASFSTFRDYKDRGEQFARYAEVLGKKK